jgi:hypothetical protein
MDGKGNLMQIDCVHWKDCGIPRAGCCTIGAWQTPSHEACLTMCELRLSLSDPDLETKLEIINNPKKPKPKKKSACGSRGFGDTIKSVIDKVTLGKVKPCGGCKKRQEALNKLLPYKEKGGK